MDYFSLCLNLFCLVGQALMHLAFVSRLTGKRAKVRHFGLYVLALSGVELFSALLAINALVSIGAGLLALWAMGCFALGNRPSVSLTAATIAVYIFQCSFGLVNSVESVVFPGVLGSPLLYLLVFLAALAAFGICAGCYMLALKALSLGPSEALPHMGLLLVPGLFAFGAELYILYTAYGVLPAKFGPEEAGRHMALMVLQAAGLGALLCALYAYRHLCRGFQAQAALQSLTQAAEAQRVYITEAQKRYEQTRSFRHDVKNHLALLDGLLGGGKLEEGREYLKKLETVSEALSFPYQTGSPVVDILLGEKLGLAEDIETEVSLVLPKSCRVDEPDLCVIFANALDNALSACRLAEDRRQLRVTGKRQGDFFMLTFENSCVPGPLAPEGTGLSNIRAAAEKYRGAVLTEKADGWFSLCVLLDIS